MLKAALAGAFALLASDALARPVTVPAGTALTFGLSGTPPRPGPTRPGALGSAEPGPGEITVGLAPADTIAQIAKLHVYERTAAPISFEATALRGGRTLTTQTVCGRVEMDAWITVPPGTERVALSGFAASTRGCTP